MSRHKFFLNIFSLHYSPPFLCPKVKKLHNMPQLDHLSKHFLDFHNFNNFFKVHFERGVKLESIMDGEVSFDLNVEENEMFREVEKKL